MLPGFTKGEMISNGTRGPKPNRSIWGGATWSYKPPKSSHVTKTTVEFQSGPCMIAFKTWTVQFSPLQILAGGCSETSAPSEKTQLIAGRFPVCASVMICSFGTKSAAQYSLLRNMFIDPPPVT